jgi:hypothetical protein
LQKFKVVDKNIVAVGNAALHLQARRRAELHALLGMKRHSYFGRHQCHVIELQQKITLPTAPIELAVRDDLQTQRLLHFHHALYGLCLDSHQLFTRYVSTRMIGPGVQQVLGSDKTAHMVSPRKGVCDQSHKHP